MAAPQIEAYPCRGTAEKTQIHSRKPSGEQQPKPAQRKEQAIREQPSEGARLPAERSEKIE